MPDNAQRSLDKLQLALEKILEDYNSGTMSTNEAASQLVKIREQIESILASLK